MIVHVSSIQDYILLLFHYWPLTRPGIHPKPVFYLQVTMYTIVHLNSTQSVEKTLKSCVYCVHWNLCTDVHTQDKYSTAESTSSQLKFEKNLRVESDKKPVDSPS